MSNIGRYRLEEFLGAGGMGEVHRALDPTLGRSVAIKTIPLGRSREPGERERLLARLRREAESAGGLSHPGIVTIHDFLEEGDLACIVMEYIAGRTLDKLMRPGRPLDKETCLGVLRQAAAALDHAHQHGVIHRDIKPANIILEDKDGLLKILDFGVAKLASAESLTTSGHGYGTHGYMSPEHYGAGPVEAPADQFSLAVMAYELLTGVNPFAAETPAAVMHRVMREEPPPVGRFNPGLSGQVNDVLRRALAKTPRNRYPSCVQFVAALGWAALASIPDREPVTERTRHVQAPPAVVPKPAAAVSPPPPQPVATVLERAARRKAPALRTWLAAGAAAIILGVIGLLVYGNPGRKAVSAGLVAPPRQGAARPPAPAPPLRAPEAPKLEVTTGTTLPEATRGRPYSCPLGASGGVPPYRWSLARGALPDGLSLLSEQGIILGTPTRTGRAEFSLQLSDSRGTTALRELTLNVRLVPPPLVITTSPALPEGIVGQHFVLELGASGGTPPYHWSVTGDDLPRGLELDEARGVLEGTPRAPDAFQFTVRLSDSFQAVTTREFRLRVVPELKITAVGEWWAGFTPTGGQRAVRSCPPATAGQPYSCNLEATGGSPPYRWEIADGSLPPGLSLDPGRGRISGTPSRSGEHSFRLRVVDRSQASAGVGPFPLTVGSLQGTIEWHGNLESNAPLIIQGRHASHGALDGELPGTPVKVQVSPRDVVVVSPPGPSAGGWKNMVLNSPDQRQTRIVIRWTDQR
jgi:serine/threonine-protein kinase